MTKISVAVLEVKPDAKPSVFQIENPNTAKRRHVLYEVEVGDKGSYVGFTAVKQGPQKSVKDAVKHMYNLARNGDETQTKPLVQEAMKEAAPWDIKVNILETVKNRKAAVNRRKELIMQMAPALNGYNKRP